MSAHPALVNTGQLALILLITTLLCALLSLEGEMDASVTETEKLFFFIANTGSK